MRPMYVTVGAALLVLGAAMMAVGPFVVETSLYKQELSFVPSNQSVNQSTIYSAYDNAANQGELTVLIGVVAAPVGAALMAYGLTSKKPESPSSAPTTAPSAH